MSTKMYLRNTAGSGYPTAGKKSTTNPKYTAGANVATGAQEQLLLSTTKGGTNAGTNHVFTSDATTSTRTNYMGRWTSPGMAAQSIASGTWTFASAFVETNTNADSLLTLCVYLAAQGGSSIKATIYDASTDLGTEWGTGTTGAGRVVTFSGSAVSADLNDVLVVEVFRNTDATGQAMATAYDQAIYFGGATEPTASSDIVALDVATYLETPAAVNLNFDTSVFNTQQRNQLVVKQAVKRAAFY